MTNFSFRKNYIFLAYIFCK